MDKKIKVAIVDDHEMFRSGIKLILSEFQKVEFVLEAENGKDFLEQAVHLLPDIVLMDISMPVMDGYETVKKALLKYPDLKVIVLSMLSDQQYYYKMIEAGVKGFIKKDSGVDELYRSIDEVAKGNNYFTQDLLKSIVLRINTQKVDDSLKLSKKEIEVLAFICNGFTNKEISEKMFLSVKTIEKYRTSLLQKTNTRNSAHLVMFAMQNNLVNF